MTLPLWFVWIWIVLSLACATQLFLVSRALGRRVKRDQLRERAALGVDIDRDLQATVDNHERWLQGLRAEAAGRADPAWRAFDRARREPSTVQRNVDRWNELLRSDEEHA